MRLCRSMEKYPKRYFAGMSACIVVSAVLAFTVFRVKDPKTVIIPEGGNSIATGVAEIASSGAAFREVLDLQNKISIVLRKDSLDGRDSALVKAALKRLETINREPNSQKQTKP